MADTGQHGSHPGRHGELLPSARIRPRREEPAPAIGNGSRTGAPVGGGGARALWYNGTRAAADSTRWLAGSMLTVMFTGSYYEVLSIAGAWTPSIAGTSTYSFQEGYFQYSAGIVSFGFSISGIFSSTTTSTTQTVISGLPFTYKGNGLAAGGGIAYGCTSSSPGFFGWCVSNGQSTITARNSTISGNIYGAGYVYNTPGFTYSVSGSITMRAV